MAFWIDTHSHLDAPDFERNGLIPVEFIAQSAIDNVAISVIPAVERSNFDTVRELAQTHLQAYALGIHPLYVPNAKTEDLLYLDEMLERHKHDRRLVAVGEIGLDFFVPELCTTELRKKQTHFYLAQLKLAKKHQLPLILHVRKSADELLHGLREIERTTSGFRTDIGENPSLRMGGIAHAFNGSAQQAEQFLKMGFALGFGGAVSYQRASNLRRLAQSLPPEAIVMETDAPDMPPHWLYATAQEQAAGKPQGINSPLELPRIGQVVADLRGVGAQAWAQQTSRNALRVLPKLAALIPTQFAL